MVPLQGLSGICFQKGFYIPKHRLEARAAVTEGGSPPIPAGERIIACLPLWNNHANTTDHREPHVIVISEDRHVHPP
jgi:hypothetical protein